MAPSSTNPQLNWIQIYLYNAAKAKGPLRSRIFRNYIRLLIKHIILNNKILGPTLYIGGIGSMTGLIRVLTPVLIVTILSIGKPGYILMTWVVNIC